MVADPKALRPSDIASADWALVADLTPDDLARMTPWSLRAYALRIGQTRVQEVLDACDLADETKARTFYALNDAACGSGAVCHAPHLDCSTEDLLRWARERTPLAWQMHVGSDLALVDALIEAYEDIAARLGDPQGRLASSVETLRKLGLSIVRGESLVGKPMAESQSGPAANEPFPGDVTLIRGDTVKPEPVDWLWPGYLAAGKLHVLAGAPGTGKTTLALALAAKLTTGDQWPDGSRAPTVNVAIWSAEDDTGDTLVPRLMAAGADMRRVHFVSETVSAEGERRPFDPATDTGHLARALAGLQVRLLVIDPVVNVVTGDSHKNTETRRALQPLVELASKLGCAVLGITHFSKGTQGRDPVERVVGSVAFGALSRLVFATAKAGDDDVDVDGCDRLFVRSKSNLGVDGGGFRYALEQVPVPGHSTLFASRVRWGSPLEGEARALLATAEAVSDPEEKNALADAAEFLRSLLAEGAMHAKDVFEAGRQFGHSERALQRAANKLRVERRKEGMRGGWVWRLPSEPVRFAKIPEDA